MAYHYNTQKTLTSAQRQMQEAPAGYHYMPDGTLMSDAEHDRLFPQPLSPETPPTEVVMEKRIENLRLSTNDIAASGENRTFVVTGDAGATFSLEIKNEDSYYYNFQTNLFQATSTRLTNGVISGGGYKVNVKFPTVTDDDQYDVYLFAEPGTKHTNYKEVRFADGSLDINSSSGSNSLLLQKVLYQYTDVTITLSTYSPSAAISITPTNDTIVTSRRKGVTKIPFTISTAVAVNKEIKIDRVPTINDIMAFAERTVGSAPEDIPGEDIYPRVSDTDTVDGAVTSGIKVVMDNNVADKMLLGDRITTAVSTDTVDGAVSSGVKIVMDNNVATRMAVGDRVTGTKIMDATQTLVAALNPDGDNVKEFSVDFAGVGAIDDGATLTFSSELNRNTTTVAALNPDGDNVKEFSMSQAIALVDGATLSFSNRKNYRWPLNNTDKLTSGMKVLGTNVVTGTTISPYKETVKVLEGEKGEHKIIKKSVLALDAVGAKPTMSKGLVTAQTGNIVFNNQQPYSLISDDLKIYGYGNEAIKNLYDYDIELSDLKIKLDTITTTTTAAVSNSTTIPVAEQGSIMDDVSTMSGIGVNSAVVDPTVTNKAAATGAGNLTVSAAQTLESGITLTFNGAGRTATITGNIKVNEVGNSDITLRFDVDKFLTSS